VNFNFAQRGRSARVALQEVTMLTIKTVRRLVIAGILPVLIAAYYVVALPGTPPAHAGAHNGATQPTAEATQQMLPDFTRIVEQNGPAVVNVSVSRKAPAGDQAPFQGIPEDDPMFEFFRRFHPAAGQPMQRGQGSDSSSAPTASCSPRPWPPTPRHRRQTPTSAV
jgi:S1-C subfamily serine protease